MNDKIKNILITLAFILGVVGVALLVTMIAFSDKKEEPAKHEVEIGNASAIAKDVQTPTDAPTTETTTEVTTEAVLATPEVTEEATPSVPDSNYLAEDYQDVSAPIFLIKPKTISVSQNTVFDIKEHIGYADDVDRDVEVIISGSVNTSELGSTSIGVTLRDDVGHETVSNFTVNVVEGETSTEPTNPAPGTEDFSTFVSKYGNENVSLGIDVSRWQGDIDFQKVKNAGCEFVIIRLGGCDDGELYTDRYYAQNIKNAKNAGLKVGIYWHAEESSIEEVENSCKYLLGILGGEKLDFPIAYDWEDFSKFQYHKMNLYDLNNCFNTFAKEMQDAGYSACLYSSKNFLENSWTNPLGLDVWLAHYTSSTNYSGKYYMWQHSSSGKIDGISGAVDLNIFYKKEN